MQRVSTSPPPASAPPPSAGKRKSKRWLLALGLLAAIGMAGCQTLGYYAQSVGGHVRLMNAARPVGDWLVDPATPPALQAKLQLAQQLRAFASAELHLPDNASYRSFADLKRRAAVWNVAAAPADSLRLKSFCFVVLGCVSYQGYFDEGEAQALGAQLAAQGWEVDVYPVPAYSTLGKLNWLGGDPLLSTFIGYPEGELAGLIFHELAHQQLYIDHDSAFNESFATAVERLGVRQWLATRPAAEQAAHAAAQAHKTGFRDLLRSTRTALAAAYGEAPAQVLPKAGAATATASASASASASAELALGSAGSISQSPPENGRQIANTAQPNSPQAQVNRRTGDGPPPAPDPAVLARKAEVMRGFHADYAALKQRWADEGAPDARYDRWVAKANNASFGMQAVYQGWVPAFEALFAREGGDWPRFFAAAQALGQLPRAERDAALRALTPASAMAAQLD